MGAVKRRSQDSWDAFFYSMAMLVGGRSKDPHRQVGCVLASRDRRQVSIGYNGLPADVPDDDELLNDRERKNRLMLHAERNCLAQAPFVPHAGCTLYATRFPCLECAQAILRAGVARLVCPPPDLRHRRWGKEWTRARAQLLASGVRVAYIHGTEAPHG